MGEGAEQAESMATDGSGWERTGVVMFHTTTGYISPSSGPLIALKAAPIQYFAQRCSLGTCPLALLAFLLTLLRLLLHHAGIRFRPQRTNL